MKRGGKWVAWLMAAGSWTGCSTSPCADFLDHFFPAKPPANTGPGRGGVCNPATLGPGGAISPNTIPGALPGGTVPVVPAPGSVVVPGQPQPGVVVPAPGTTSPPPPLSGLDVTPNSLVSAPPMPGGPEVKPLPAPPVSSPPPF